MKVVITGGTGFLGRTVVARLVDRGDSVIALTRDPRNAARVLPRGAAAIAWSPDDAHGPWETHVAGADAVIHLAGEPAMARRWNAGVKARILESRVRGARHLVDAMETAGNAGTRVFVSASGIDYYGDTGEAEATEESPAGGGFLASVCIAWENEARRAERLGAREVRLRLAVVLGENGGALDRMATAFKWFAGGPIGDGRQWFAWIAHEDAVRIVLRAVDDAGWSGAWNACAPAPARMRAVASAIGRAVGTPSWATVPAVALRIVVGEGATVLLESKRVVPDRLLRAGFEWAQPDLDGAIGAALQRRAPAD